MKINMNAPILALDGNPVAGEGGPVVLRTIVQGALMATLTGDEKIPGDHKAKMFGLAIDANKATVDWGVEDITLVKQRVGEAASPLAVGRAYELLDPKG